MREKNKQTNKQKKKQVVWDGVTLPYMEEGLSWDGSKFPTYKFSWSTMALPPYIVSLLQCQARERERERERESEGERKRFFLFFSFFFNVPTSFPPSTTTGKVWHCCVECDFDIRERILSGDVAAPPAPAERERGRGRGGKEGEREKERGGDAEERVLQDERRTRGGGGHT